MFELATSYIIFNMATSYFSKMSIYNTKKKSAVATALKKTYLIKQFYRPCSGTVIFLILFYLQVENQLKLTLAKGNFN